MSEREGPAISYSCHGCKHYRQSRYSCQGDSGYDKSCAFTEQARDMDEYGGTPSWCPVLARTSTVVLTGDDLSIASDLRVRISANWENHSEPLQSMHLALLDKLLGGAK